METVNLISKLPLGSMRAEEALQVGDQLLAATVSYRTEAFKLLGVCNLLTESIEAARATTETVKAHPLSAAIAELAEKVDNEVLALLSINRGHKRTVPLQFTAAAATTVPFIEKAFAGYSTSNVLIKSERLVDFFATIDSKPELSSAMEAVSLKPLTDELRNLQTELLTLREKRTKEKVGPVTETKLLQVAQVKSMIRRLLTTIETNAMTEPDVDYKPLIANINNIAAEVKKIVNMRRAAQRNNLASATNATAPVATTIGTVNNEVA